jgi:hypothetical protein
MNLKLRAIGVNTSPNTFIKTHDENATRVFLENLPNDVINFKEWQKMEIPYQGRNIKKMRITNIELPKEDFVEKVTNEMHEFHEHVRRCTTQYTEIANLRKQLQPMTEITCQIDYSENYNCSYQDEPAQVFFDKKQITIHPMVIHYRDMSGTLKHTSFVGISEETNHSAPTTLAFFMKMIPKLQE